MKSNDLICAQCNGEMTTPNDGVAGGAPFCPRCGTAVDVHDQDSFDDSGTKADVAGAATELRPKDTSGSDPEILDSAVASERSTPAIDFLRPAEAKGEIGRLGQYRVISVLGEGGMGLVFRAEDVLLKRPVALKVIKPEVLPRPGAKDRFLREAQSVANLEHEHIIPIHQVGIDQSVLFLAMPLLKGETLENRMKRNPPLRLSEIVRIARETAEGLAAAHAQGLIHRDIKPGNLWLEASKEDGTVFRRVKVLDFGLARIQDSEDRLTRSGTVLGTPAFMSPEQAAGEVVDARADLWSLGVVLYKMLSGKNPFSRGDMLSTLAAVAVEEPTPLHELNPKVPKALSDLVARMIVKDANMRIAKAAQVAAELDRIQQAMKPKSLLRRWRWPLVGATALMLGLGVAAVIFFTKTPSQPVRPVAPPPGTKVTPEEAIKLEDADVTVEFPIKSAGKTKTGTWFMLNSKSDYQDENNFQIAIKQGTERMAEFGLEGDLVDRVAQARGVVTKFRGRPQVIVSEPAQLKLLPK